MFKIEFWISKNVYLFKLKSLFVYSKQSGHINVITGWFVLVPFGFD